jgi:hypothetical protein
MYSLRQSESGDEKENYSCMIACDVSNALSCSMHWILVDYYCWCMHGVIRTGERASMHERKDY